MPVSAGVEAGTENFVQGIILTPYFFSFVAGALMIAIFARRRMDILSSEFSSDYASILKLTRASVIVGRRQYNLAYSLYLFTLLAVYGFLCLCQPVAGYLIGETAVNELWATPAGPFAVASFLVAVGPNAAWFENLEITIRRLAQRLAGIPEDLYDLLNTIKRFNLSDPNYARSFPYDEFEDASEAQTAASLVRLDESEGVALRNNLISIFAIHSWLIAEAGRNIWSDAIRAHFTDQTDQIRKDFKRLNNDLHMLLKETAQTDFFKKSLLFVSSPDANDERTKHKALVALRQEYESVVSPLARRWEEFAEEAARVAATYRVVFALYTVNDRNPSFDRNEEPALAKLLEQVWRPRINHTLNLVSLAALSGFVASFLAVFGWKVFRYLTRGDVLPPRTLLVDAITFAINNALGTFFMLIMPMFLAVFVRFSKKSDRNWISADTSAAGAAGFPFFQYARIIMYASLTSIVLSSSWYFIKQLVFTEGGTISLQDFFSEVWINKAIISVSGGMLACMLCYILDKWESGSIRIRDLVVFPLFTSIGISVYVTIVHFYVPPSEFFLEKSPLSDYKSEWYDTLVQDVLVYAAFTFTFTLVVIAIARRRASTPGGG